jgi:hypothetical protein
MQAGYRMSQLLRKSVLWLSIMSQQSYWNLECVDPIPIVARSILNSQSPPCTVVGSRCHRLPTTVLVLQLRLCIFFSQKLPMSSSTTTETTEHFYRRNMQDHYHPVLHSIPGLTKAKVIYDGVTCIQDPTVQVGESVVNLDRPAILFSDVFKSPFERIIRAEVGLIACNPSPSNNSHLTHR